MCVRTQCATVPGQEESQSVMVRRCTLLVVSCLLLLPASLFAGTVTWYLNSSFNDGGSASGSFGWDADTSIMSTWDIVTTPGAVNNGTGGPLPGFTYDGITSTGNISLVSGFFFQVVATPSLDPFFRFSTSSSLTDAGGTFALRAGGNDYESRPSGSQVRFVVSGSLTTAPEPQSLPLAVVGGLSLWILCRIRGKGRRFY